MLLLLNVMPHRYQRSAMISYFFAEKIHADFSFTPNDIFPCLVNSKTPPWSDFHKFYSDSGGNRSPEPRIFHLYWQARQQISHQRIEHGNTSLHPSINISWYVVRMDGRLNYFFQGWGGGNNGEISFHQLKTKIKIFCYPEKLIGRCKRSKSRGPKLPSSLQRPC